MLFVWKIINTSTPQRLISLNLLAKPILPHRMFEKHVFETHLAQRAFCIKFGLNVGLLTFDGIAENIASLEAFPHRVLQPDVAGLLPTLPSVPRGDGVVGGSVVARSSTGAFAHSKILVIIIRRNNRGPTP